MNEELGKVAWQIAGDKRRQFDEFAKKYNSQMSVMNLCYDAATEMADYVLSHLWHDAKKELPRTSGKYIIMMSIINHVREAYYNAEKLIWTLENTDCSRRIHIQAWMPIPELPKED